MKFWELPRKPFLFEILCDSSVPAPELMLSLPGFRTYCTHSPPSYTGKDPGLWERWENGVQFSSLPQEGRSCFPVNLILSTRDGWSLQQLLIQKQPTAHKISESLGGWLGQWGWYYCKEEKEEKPSSRLPTWHCLHITPQRSDLCLWQKPQMVPGFCPVTVALLLKQHPYMDWNFFYL